MWKFLIKALSSNQALSIQFQEQNPLQPAIHKVKTKEIPFIFVTNPRFSLKHFLAYFLFSFNKCIHKQWLRNKTESGGPFYALSTFKQERN
jgi:hypothetical protein